MTDSTEITLPVSNKKVELRTYTTRKDDMRSQEILYMGVNSKMSMSDKGSKDTKMDMDFPIANVMASREAYVPRLVMTIDGNASNIQNQIDELHSKDYSYLFNEVEKIVDENNPKAEATK